MQDLKESLLLQPFHGVRRIPDTKITDQLSKHKHPLCLRRQQIVELDRKKMNKLAMMRQTHKQGLIQMDVLRELVVPLSRQLNVDSVKYVASLLNLVLEDRVTVEQVKHLMKDERAVFQKVSLLE